MKSLINPALFVCSIALSLPALANKGAAYTEKPSTPSTDNLDWSKGWYIGLGINNDGIFSEDVTGVSSLIGFTTDEVDLSNSNIGFDVYLGREISKYWAVELGYTYVGNLDVNGETDEGLIQSATVKQWNVHAVGLGRLPLGEHFDFMIKGGPAWYFNSEKFEDVATDLTVHSKYRGFALTYGAGLEVFWDQFVVRADYTMISPPNNIQDDFWVTDIAGLSFIYKFI